MGADLPSGGDVWVLVIKTARPTDSGIYVCEVNSNPIVRSFHKLSGNIFCFLPYFLKSSFRFSQLQLVLSRSITANPTDVIIYEDPQATAGPIKNHNYTDCCLSLNVSTGCLGFCNIQSILEG